MSASRNAFPVLDMRPCLGYNKKASRDTAKLLESLRLETPSRDIMKRKG